MEQILLVVSAQNLLILQDPTDMRSRHWRLCQLHRLASSALASLQQTSPQAVAPSPFLTR